MYSLGDSNQVLLDFTTSFCPVPKGIVAGQTVLSHRGISITRFYKKIDIDFRNWKTAMIAQKGVNDVRLLQVGTQALTTIRSTCAR